MRIAPRQSKQAAKIVAERTNRARISDQLWKGLLKFNREQAGPFHYSRNVLTARDATGKLLGGLILESYWRESYVELLWLAAKARGSGLGSRLLEEAERRAKKRGSRLIHLNTFSFQAPGFYEKHGYRRFGGMSGSPKGHSRHYYVKHLRAV